MKTIRHPKFGLCLLTALSLSALPVFALTPGEQANDFYARGAAAEKRGDIKVARNCYQLALRVDPNHRETLLKLGEHAKKKADEHVARGIAAEGKGDPATANVEYVLALDAFPSHVDAGKRIAELKKKMGSNFRAGKEVVTREKLRKIVIPQIDFMNVPLEAAAHSLWLRSIELDTEEPYQERAGTPIVIRGAPGAAGATDLASIRINALRLRDVPIEQVLQTICDQTKTEYRIGEDGVISITKAEETVAQSTPPPVNPVKPVTPTPVAAPPPSAKPAPASTSAPLVWKSKDGKTVEGEFVGLDGEAVVIKRDGKEFTILFTRLDPASVEQARGLATMKSDVLLHYDFTDVRGATVKDRSGNGRDGTLVGFANTEAGGGADPFLVNGSDTGILVFDGVDDTVVTPLMTSDLATGTGFTIEAVVGHRKTSGIWSSIVATDAPNVATGDIVQLGKMARVGDPECPESAIFSRISGLSLPIFKSKKPTSLGDGGLHHVALTYTPEDRGIRIYFDHRIQGQWTNLNGNIPGGGRIVIGSSGWNKAEGWFGPISEVRISKRALSPGQFLSYPKPPDVPAPKPAHRYSFSGDANDSIGMAHGKVVDAGTPTARFVDGQLDLSANKAEPSTSIREDAYVDLPNGIISKFKGRFTLDLWCSMTRWDGSITACTFGRTSVPEDVSGGAGAQAVSALHLILKASNSNDLESIFHIKQDALAANDGRTVINAGFDVSQTGVERHYTYVADVSDTLLGPHGSQHLYLDGYRIGSAALPEGVSDRLEDINNWLGRSQRSQQTFVGRYNEFRIYDRALTPHEVRASHVAGPDAVIPPAASGAPE